MTINSFIKRLEQEYAGSAFTGHWAGESIHELAMKEALRILDHALSRCKDEDVRSAEITDALEFLKGRAARTWPMDQFARALNSEHPDGRWQNVNAALNGIKRQFGQPS